MNPRLQVEHTVTELITGRDLVQTQIRVAEGYKLSDPEIDIPNQAAVKKSGFAIQCRITTEDPQNNFAPDFGTLKAYRSPAGFGVRLDAGNAFTGARIDSSYDSLLVKLSGYGLSFEHAAKVMKRSLVEFRIRGVKTNIQFLENVVTHPVFLAGKCDTSFIGEHPELMEFSEKKDRASKVLDYIGDKVINGTEGIVKPSGSLVFPEADVPEIKLGDVRKEGTRDIFNKLGPEKFSQWIKDQKKTSSYRYNYERCSSVSPCNKNKNI